MSTTAERAMERLARSITQAFTELRTATYSGSKPVGSVQVPVKCETTASKAGMGFAGTGLKLSIGDRVATFDAEGQLVGTVDLTREMTEQRRQQEEQHRKINEEIAARHRAEAIKRGDFSKVDWGGSR